MLVTAASAQDRDGGASEPDHVPLDGALVDKLLSCSAVFEQQAYSVATTDQFEFTLHLSMSTNTAVGATRMMNEAGLPAAEISGMTGRYQAAGEQLAKTDEATFKRLLAGCKADPEIQIYD
jgi:hypothetical protein